MPIKDSPLNSLYAAFAEFVTEKWDASEWISFGQETGTLDEINAHDRLLRSLSFGDDDYPLAVREVLPRVIPEAAADKTLAAQADVVADFAPELPAFRLSPRTRRRFETLLRTLHEAGLVPELWEVDAAQVWESAGGQQKAGAITRDQAVPPQEGKGGVPVPTVQHEAAAIASEGTEATTSVGQVRSPSVSPSGEDDSPAANVFLVHGRDAPMVNKVQVRVHEMTGLMPVSLADQVSGGDTVIEKFERYAADSSVALILLTPDDFGGVAGETSQPRARQNVVFEFGYFVAKLGRKKVIALNDGVELPSDLAGVVYVSLHTTNWMTTLRKELRAAGVPIID